jgi:uncharacterized membrane protein
LSNFLKVIYFLKYKDLTLVGRADAKNKQDIQLMGPGIAYEHCAFYMKNGFVCVAPIKDAKYFFSVAIFYRHVLKVYQVYIFIFHI